MDYVARAVHHRFLNNSLKSTGNCEKSGSSWEYKGTVLILALFPLASIPSAQNKISTGWIKPWLVRTGIRRRV